MINFILKLICKYIGHDTVLYNPKITHDDAVGEFLGTYCARCGYDSHGEYKNKI
ncbi:hypothetical protein D3C78_1750520 [compost metagenome]